MVGDEAIGCLDGCCIAHIDTGTNFECATLCHECLLNNWSFLSINLFHVGNQELAEHEKNTN